MLTIWGRASSLNVQKVLWLADELALDYRHVSVGGADGGLDAPDFLARNPHGRIPLIEDGETAVWESHAILRLAAAKFPMKWEQATTNAVLAMPTRIGAAEDIAPFAGYAGGLAFRGRRAGKLILK